MKLSPRIASLLILTLLAPSAFAQPIDQILIRQDGQLRILWPTTQLIPTTNPVATGLPPLEPLPADAIKIASLADFMKLSQVHDGSTVAFLRGFTYPVSDSVWLKANNLRFTSYGNPTDATPSIKWAHPTSPTGAILMIVGKNVQVDSLILDGGGFGTGAYVTGENDTIRDVTISNVNDCIMGNGATAARIDHCASTNQNGYFLFHSAGDYVVTFCTPAASKDQHAVRGVGKVELANCTFTTGNGKENVTQQGGELLMHDCTLINGDCGIGPLNVQTYTVARATIQRTRFNNARVNIVGGVGDVLLEDLTGTCTPGFNFVGIGTPSHDDVLGRTINSLTMRRLTPVLSGGSKMFVRAAAPVHFNTEPVGP